MAGKDLNRRHPFAAVVASDFFDLARTMLVGFNHRLHGGQFSFSGVQKFTVVSVRGFVNTRSEYHVRIE